MLRCAWASLRIPREIDQSSIDDDQRHNRVQRRRNYSRRLLKVTWQVRSSAGRLPFSQSIVWPLDPARFHRGTET